MNTQWAHTRDGYAVGLDSDGELSTATFVLLAGNGRHLSEVRHAAADLEAARSTFSLVPRLLLADVKPAARAMRKAARKALDTDNNGLRGGTWHSALADFVCHRWLKA